MERERSILHNTWTHNDKNVPDARQPENEKGLGNLGEIMVGKRIEEFFSEVSVVGLKYVVLTGALYVRKAIWLLFVLGGLGFMIFQFHDRISYFLSNPTSVSVTIKTMKQLEFPTVTICNENFVARSRADLLPGYEQLIADIYPPWPDESFEPNFGTLEFLEEVLNITDWGELWLWTSPFIESSLWQHCIFNNEACDFSQIRLVATEMGFCLQFNGEDVNYTTSVPGQVQGFWMLLNISQNDYLYAQSRMAGVRVAIHEKHETPSFNQYSIKATPGFVTSIALNKKMVTDLPYPYTNCSEEEGYSSYDCQLTCLETYVTDYCNCAKYYYSIEGYPVCDPQEMINCTDPRETTFYTNNLASEICDCPEQCKSTKYIYTISSAAASDYSMRSIAEEEVKALGTCIDEGCDSDVENKIVALRRDMLEIEVYFQDLKVEEVVTQKAYTILALLCDIGGALGLILGATILTLFEIIDFGIVLLYDWVRYKTALRTNKKMQAKEVK